MKICVFDTESTSLTAIMGRILCASFVEVASKKPPYTFRSDKAPWKMKDPIDDSKLCVAIRDELEKYHMVVGWNSKLHDLALLNARLAKVGQRPFHPHLNLDLMYYAGGSSMKIGSRKLVNVQKFFGLKAAKTDLEWETWQRAASFDKKAMDTVAHHCEQDVLVTAECYWKLLPAVKNIHR
jgi:uncharacterized protein YprB with RNaseH-like and TPR domain